MYDNKNGRRAGSTHGKNSDNFELNIPDEMFNTIPDINISNLDSTQSFSTSRRDMEGSNSQAYYSDKERKQKKKEHKKRDKLKSIKNRRVFRVMWWVMVILVSLTLASYLISGSNDFLAIDRKEGTVVITIPKNVTLGQLTDILETSGAIKSAEFFKIYCGLTTEMSFFSEGDYKVDTNIDYEHIISVLQAGPNTNLKTIEITFREGLKLDDIAEMLEKEGVCKKEDVLAAAKTNNFDNYDMIEKITNADKKFYKLEGYLFPDTYNFSTDEDIGSVLGKMLGNFQNKITKKLKEKIDASSMSMDEVITLASIIQAEAANAEDMYKVSAVFNNRLRAGAEHGIVGIQSDPTVYYPYGSAKDVPEGYLSNYDTYKITGLPAGAITNPGLEAIKAAVSPDPEHANDFYFCHSKDGTAYYAETLDEHNSNLVTAGLVE